MGIAIRKNKLKNNRINLSLDIYQDGVSKYENLKLYLFEKPKTADDREHNRKTEAIAERIRAKRILEMQDARFNIHTGFKSQFSFIEYFKEQTRQRRRNFGSYGNWSSALKHLLVFCKGKDVKFADCDEVFLTRFKEFLLTANLTKSNTRLSNNSASSYLNKVKAALNPLLCLFILWGHCAASDWKMEWVGLFDGPFEFQWQFGDRIFRIWIFCRFVGQKDTVDGIPA